MRAKYLKSLLLCSILTGSALAAPYGENGKIVEFTQPDGTSLSLRVLGDEYYARTETLDGRTVVFNKQGNCYHYANVAPDGTSFERGDVVGKPGARKPIKGLKLSRKARKEAWEGRQREFAGERNKRWNQRLRKRKEKGDEAVQNAADDDAHGHESEAGAPQLADISGAKEGLMILVQFPDDPSTVENDAVDFPTTVAKMERYCNELGYSDDGNTDSVRGYLFDQSGGALDYTQVVTAVITLPHPRSYYNYTDSPTNSSLRSNGAAGRLVVSDAVAELQALNFDFTPFTRNSSDKILSTNILFAGSTSGVWAEGLWPHAYSLSGSGINVGQGGDTIYVDAYQMTNLTNTSPKIGTYIHETGHLLLGYPDLYDYGGESSGVGRHCLMGSGNYLNGGRTPAPINAYFKETVGWLDYTEVNVLQNVDVSLPTTGNVACRVINPSNSNEFFVIENRGDGDRWASGTYDKGIMIWHVDTAKNGASEEQMTEAQHYEVSLEQADGLFDLENDRDNGDSGDYFDSSDPTFSADTTPSSRWWDGTDSGLTVTVLSAAGSSMDVRFGDPVPVTQLIKDQTETLSAVVGEEERFTIDVPTGAAALYFRLSGGTGDANLYHRFDSAPTSQWPFSADFFSYDSGVIATSGQAGAANPESQDWSYTDTASNFSEGSDSANGGWRTVDGTSSAATYYSQTFTGVTADQLKYADTITMQWRVALDKDSVGANGNVVANHHTTAGNGDQTDIATRLTVDGGVDLYVVHRINSSDELLLDFGNDGANQLNTGVVITNFPSFIDVSVVYDKSEGTATVSYDAGGGNVGQVTGLEPSVGAQNRVLFGADSVVKNGSAIWNNFKVSASSTNVGSDHRSVKVGNSEYIIINQPAEGRHHILVSGWQDFQGVELVASYLDAPAAVVDVAIPFGSSWFYKDDGSDQGTAWRQLGVSETWNSGVGQLGYGDSDESTDLATNKVTYYFRKVLSVTDAAAVSSIDFDLLYDDGAVVYVNGQEIHRTALIPDGEVLSTTTATSSSPDNSTTTFSIGNTHLVDGENLIAVEVHNQSSGSSDISFDMQVSVITQPTATGFGYTAWAGIVFDASDGGQGATDDFNGNGLTNLEEFAFNFDPKADSTALEKVLQRVEGAASTFSFERRTGANLSWDYLVSTDMNTWEVGTEGVDYLLTYTPFGGTEMVEVELLKGAPVFLRLQVSAP